MYDLIYPTRFFMKQGKLPGDERKLLDFVEEIEQSIIELGKIDKLLEKVPVDIECSKKTAPRTIF